MFLPSKKKKSLLLLRFLRYLRTFRGPSWVFLGNMKNPCYFCDFCDICGHFGVLLGFFCFQKKILVTFAIFAIFADISEPFMGVFREHEKSLLLLRFLRYLRTFRSPSWVFLGNMKNPCYFCDFCDICGHFGVLLGFFCFQVLILVRFVIFAIFVTGVFGTFRGPSWVFLGNMKNPCYFCDFCDICGHYRALLGFFCFQVLISC